MKYQIQDKNGQRIVNLNRRRAIRERCLNCSGWVFNEKTECEFSSCQLYPFRSGQGKQCAKNRSAAIRSYCLSCMNGQRNAVKLCPSQDCPIFPYRMSTIDRTAEIKSMPESGHIEAVSEPKIKLPYLRMDNEKQEQNNLSLTGAGIGSREKMVLSPWQNHRSNHSRGMSEGKRTGSTES